MINSFVAGLIFAISPLALLQFFAWYCHSLIARSRERDLSDQVREISGLTPRTVRGDQFIRLLQLTSLYPAPGGDGHQLRAVSAYFNMLGFVHGILRRAFPAAMQWIESERGGCAYVAAVALDRRITFSQMLISGQAVPLS